MDGGRIRTTGDPERVLTPDQLSGAYGEDVRVITDPGTGLPVVLPTVGERP